MRLTRRGFLKAGAAAVVAAGGPAILHAQTAKGKVRLAYLQLGWAATEIIHKEDLLGKRGWQAEYSIVPGSPVPLLNQLTAKNVDAIDMSFALAAKAFEDGAPLKVTGVATAVLGRDRRPAGGRRQQGRGPEGPQGCGRGRHLDVLRHSRPDAEGLRIRSAEGRADRDGDGAARHGDACWPRATSTRSSPGSRSPTRSCLRGQGVYLAKQIDLWRKATGRPTGFPVHVCYLVHGDFLARNPSIAKDLNDAQKDAVDVWYNKPERAMEIVADVTKLPPDVIKVAYTETVKMLSGLPDEQVETLIAQLKINKEFGFLKSDLWDNPDRIRKEFFHRA